MTTAITNPDDIIDQMVTLRLQQAKLNEQINTLKPQFFEACATQEAARFEHKQAVISRRLLPGKWDYPDHVVEQEEELKKVKGHYRALEGLLMVGSLYAIAAFSIHPLQTECAISLLIALIRS